MRPHPTVGTQGQHCKWAELGVYPRHTLRARHLEACIHSGRALEPAPGERTQGSDSGGSAQAVLYVASHCAGGVLASFGKHRRVEFRVRPKRVPCSSVGAMVIRSPDNTCVPTLDPGCAGAWRPAGIPARRLQPRIGRLEFPDLRRTKWRHHKSPSPQWPTTNCLPLAFRTGGCNRTCGWRCVRERRSGHSHTSRAEPGATAGGPHQTDPCASLEKPLTTAPRQDEGRPLAGKLPLNMPQPISHNPGRERLPGPRGVRGLPGPGRGRPRVGNANMRRMPSV